MDNLDARIEQNERETLSLQATVSDPWTCSPGWCAGCSFEKFEGDHPTSCRCHQ